MHLYILRLKWNSKKRIYFTFCYFNRFFCYLYYFETNQIDFLSKNLDAVDHSVVLIASTTCGVIGIVLLFIGCVWCRDKWKKVIFSELVISMFIKCILFIINLFKPFTADFFNPSFQTNQIFERYLKSFMFLQLLTHCNKTRITATVKRK